MAQTLTEPDARGVVGIGNVGGFILMVSVAVRVVLIAVPKPAITSFRADRLGHGKTKSVQRLHETIMTRADGGGRLRDQWNARRPVGHHAIRRPARGRTCLPAQALSHLAMQLCGRAG